MHKIESEEDDVEAEEQAKKCTKVPKGSGPSTYTSDKVKKMSTFFIFLYNYFQISRKITKKFAYMQKK